MCKNCDIAPRRRVGVLEIIMTRRHVAFGMAQAEIGADYFSVEISDCLNRVAHVLRAHAHK